MTATNQSNRSPAPGIIPDPVHVHDDPAALTAARRGGSKPGRRNPLGIAAARVMSALHGDKYMVDAYPAAGPEHAAAPGAPVAGGTSAERPASRANPAGEC